MEPVDQLLRGHAFLRAKVVPLTLRRTIYHFTRKFNSVLVKQCWGYP